VSAAAEAERSRKQVDFREDKLPVVVEEFAVAEPWVQVFAGYAVYEWNKIFKIFSSILTFFENSKF
jgi:hypothetical protein